MNISDAQREDAGEYRLNIHNSIGSDTTSFKVIVNDRPEPPRFPNVESILDEAAVLSWKPPNLDGGSLVTKYVILKKYYYNKH